MIRRSQRPTEHFTILRNDVLRDTRLSFRARGLLAAILSRPDNWTIRSTQLATEGGEGRDAIRSALAELRNYGYLHIEKVRMADGTFMTEQVVYDHPAAKALVAPETENPASENQASENQASVFQAPLEETVRSTKKEETKRKTKSISSSSVDDGFEKFWTIYPRKVGKGAAFKAWKKARKTASDEQIIAACNLYAVLRRTQDPQYTAHPATWLNQERWLDETVTPEQPENEIIIPTWTSCGNCHNGWIETYDDALAPCPCTKGEA